MARRSFYLVSDLVAPLLILSFAFIASAQEAAPNRTADTDSAKTEQAKQKQAQERASDLLDSIAGRAAALRSPENRVRAQAIVADLIWEKDEKHARAIFASVTADVAAIVAAIDPSDQQAGNSLNLINQVRMGVIDKLARRDPEMALAFLRATRLPSVGGQRAFYDNNEADMELRLANLIAGKDPEAALRIARESLARGLTYNLIGVLSQLEQKNKATAQTFYKEIVAKLKSEGLAPNQNASNLAVNLLASFTPPQADEGTYRELMEMAIEAALTPGLSQMNPSWAQNERASLRSLMPQIEKYDPTRIPALEQWSAAVESVQDPNTRMWAEMNAINEKGTVDDMLALGSRYPPEMQAQIYQSAVWKALSGEDVNRARQIASDLISDPGQRRQMLEQIDHRILMNAINQNKLAEARQMLSKLTAVDQRARTLEQIANTLAAKGDKPGALVLLNEAKALLDSAPQSSIVLAAELELVQAYSTLDMAQSFAILQPLVPRLNELVAAATVLDGFENHYLKDGEWMVPGSSGLSNLVNMFSQHLASLAAQDFDRARALSDQLERPEIRLMIQLQMAQMLSRGQSGRRDFNSRAFFGGGSRYVVVDQN
jgi:hypothetical protein